MTRLFGSPALSQSLCEKLVTAAFRAEAMNLFDPLMIDKRYKSIRIIVLPTSTAPLMVSSFIGTRLSTLNICKRTNGVTRSTIVWTCGVVKPSVSS